MLPRFLVPYYLEDNPMPNLSNTENSIGPSGSIGYEYLNRRTYTYGPYDTEQTDCGLNNQLYQHVQQRNPSTVLDFAIEHIVSNKPYDSLYSDPSLEHPSGITVVGDTVWVANTASGLVTSYSLLGEPLNTIINVFEKHGIIGQPTDISYNISPNSFIITNGPLMESSALLVSTRNGCIHGININVDQDNSIELVDNSDHKSVYTSIQVVNNRNASFVYVTDFYNAEIHVYDSNMIRQTDFSFIDEDNSDPIPETFAPYSITDINNQLYVSYAKQRACDNQYPEFGQGYGYVSIFTYEGEFVKRFCSKSVLDTPWSIIPVPKAFGWEPGSIAIGNEGNGIINIFTKNGEYLDSIRDNSFNTIYTGRLKGMTIDHMYQDIIYFTSTENNMRESFVNSLISRRIF